MASQQNPGYSFQHSQTSLQPLSMATARRHSVKPTTVLDLCQRLSDPETTDKEKKALRLLMTRMIEVFENDTRLDYMHEASALSESSTQGQYETITIAFSNAIITGSEDGTIIHQKLLNNFGIVLHRAKYGLTPETAKHGIVLDSLRRRLDKAVKDAALETQYHLVCMIACVIDAMVDLHIVGIDREHFREPLLATLETLKKNDEPRLAQISHYAHRGLLNINDNESTWEAFRRNTWVLVQATANVTGAVAGLDPSKITDAIPSIFQVLDIFRKIVDAGAELASLYVKGNEIFIEAVRSGSQRRTWYLALRYTGMLIESKAFEILKDLLGKDFCDSEEAFFCGFYAQLEQAWVAGEDSVKQKVEELIESTLSKSSQLKYTLQWINLIGATMNRDNWVNLRKKSRSRLKAWFKKDEPTPKLKLFHDSKPSSEKPISLLEAAWQSCEAAKAICADLRLTEHYQQGKRLEIIRLSGDQLSLDECYINLSIIEREDARTKERGNSFPSDLEFSITKRLKVEATSEEKAVDLTRLFDDRTTANGIFRPRRILIRGRAGVGKTTLCKKIVHEFIHNGMWAKRFDRIVWIPLRRLRGFSSPEHFLRTEIFSGTLEHNDLFPALESSLWDDTLNTRTMFLLDGLDEISQDHKDVGYRLAAPLSRLLNRKTVIITSRPYGLAIPDLAKFDMELETVGFLPEEVDTYIENTMACNLHRCNETRAKRVQDMQNFIKQHWLIQGLIRIPIQLDAFCFTWEDSTFFHNAPANMSGLYEAIELKLCNKDIWRLERREPGAPILRTRVKMMHYFGDILAYLEALAFAGLYNQTAEFNQDCRDLIDAHVLPHSEVVEDQLEKLSFLRAVDSFTIFSKCKEYYFIHLTFQEYFAARYFVQHWTERRPLVSVDFVTGSTVQICPNEFIECEKYNAHYDIMWRFVTGLLQTDYKSALYQFLQKLQDEPRDLLGPTHLRLLMHCFSELSITERNDDLNCLKTWLDRRLAQYLLFEGQINTSLSGDGLVLKANRFDHYCSSSLGYEVEFSEALLGVILENEIIPYKQIVLETMSKRPQILPDFVQRVAFCFEDDTPRDLRAALARVCASHAHVLSETAIKLARHPDLKLQRVLRYSLTKQSRLPEAILHELLLQLDLDYVTTIFAVQKCLPSAVIQKLVTLLKDPNPDTRFRAFSSLGHHQALVEPTINLFAIISDENPKMRQYAGYTLRTQGNLPSKILRAVVLQMAVDSDPRVRYSMTTVLRNQENISKDMVAALRYRMADSDNNVVNEAFSALRKYGLLSKDLITQAFANSRDPSRLAIAMIAQFIDISSTVPYDILKHCISLRKSSDTSTANKAVYALGIDPRLPTKILEELLLFLDKANNEGRVCVCIALSHQHNLSESSLAIIANYISVFSLHPDWINEMRELAKNLAKCSTLPHAILQQFVIMLDDTQPRQAIEALTNQSNLPSDIIRSVKSRLESENSWTRHGAEQILRRKEFYCLVPHLGANEWASWLKVLREKSFRERIICYMKKGHLCVEMPGTAWKFSMEDPAQKGKLREALKALDGEMGERVGDAFDALGFAPEADLERVYVRELDVYV